MSDKISIVTNDNVVFEISSEFLNHSKVLYEMYLEWKDDESTEKFIIYLPIIDSDTVINSDSMKLIIDFLIYEKDNHQVWDICERNPKLHKELDKKIPKHYATFIEKYNLHTVRYALTGANFLDIKNLVEICSAYVAVKIKALEKEDFIKEIENKVD